MSKPVIHFAHANGFPSKTYSKIFSNLSEDFEINYLDRHAHNPVFPVTDGWERLRDELIFELETRYHQPIIGVGHSLGGILHFLAAVENPKLYQAVVMLDAPIASRLAGFGLNLLKKTRLVDKYSPSRVARFRRNRWQNREEFFRHFQTKFEKFDEDILRDYARHATIEDEKGIRLFFEPKIEAKIYRTIPHGLNKYSRRLTTPTAYIGGHSSREARLARISAMKKKFPIKFYFRDGTHLFPFEYPDQTAELIRKAISELLPSRSEPFKENK